MPRATLLTIAAVLAASGNLLAQSSPPDWKAAIVLDMIEVSRAAANQPGFVPGSPLPFRAPIGSGGRQLTAMYLVAANAKQTAYGRLLTTLEAARVDKQVGAPPAANGGTSLAMKGLAPRILGFAVEQGALTREVSGTSMTFRANPVGLAKAIQGAGIAQLNSDYALSTAQRIAGRLSLAATFDVSRGTDPGVFTGDAQQLSSWAARYTIINRRDPASAEYVSDWATLLAPAADPYQKAAESINNALGNWTDYKTWEGTLTTDVTQKVEAPYAANKDFDAAVKAFQAVLTADLKKLEALTMPAEVTAALNTYVDELAKVQFSIGNIYKFIAKGPLLTLDVTDTRDKDLPDLYTATAVFEAGLGPSRRTDFTVNGAFSTYTSKPAGVDHSLKSIDLTAQLDHPLGALAPAVIVTVAGRYSYLPHDTAASTDTPAVVASAAAAAPKGHIGVFQAKLTVPIKDSGLKVPVSVTASNRTELVKEKDVRGSIGLTVDLDVVISALGGSFR